MPTTQTDAFLQGQGVPVALPEIEAALDRLWGPAAELAGGPEIEQPRVTRVVLANVVLVNLGPDGSRVEETAEAITTHYPSRLIVVQGSDSTERTLSAEVTALCHLPEPNRPQVCSERIVLRAGPNALGLLPGAVRPLLESDLHYVLWWCDDPRPLGMLLPELAVGATRLIVDRPDPDDEQATIGTVLNLGPYPNARDIAWFGITRWRELVASFFDPPTTSALNRITSVRIRCRSKQADRIPRAGAWLAGWLAGQIGWQPVSRSEPVPGHVIATFQGSNGLVSVRIEAEEAPVGPFAQISAVELELSEEGDGSRFILLERPTVGRDQVRVRSECSSHCNLPRLVLAPESSPSHRIDAALTSGRDDPPFRRALPIVLWTLGV